MNQLVALSPTDLAPAQASLISWCDSRITKWNAELAEATESYEHAISHKWKASPFQRSMNKAASKIRFYDKIKAAIEAGYLIVPNFPIEVFAIRTKAKSPRWQEDSTAKWQTFPQQPQRLAIGAGEFQNPIPAKDSYADKDDKGRDITKYFPTDLTEELEIPLHLVKPEILRAVDKARAMKVFDQMGISTDRRGDPLILGQIVDGPSWSSKRVTFFVAWFVDLDRV